jgi:hypothetical protein
MRNVARVALLVAAAALADGCCGLFCPVPMPDHVGVPDEESRSPTFALPLSSEDAKKLETWLAKPANLNPHLTSGGPEPILAALSDAAMWPKGAAFTTQQACFIALTGVDWRPTVSDARAEDALIPQIDAFAFGAAHYVWVVYAPEGTTKPPKCLVIPERYVLTVRAE